MLTIYLCGFMGCGKTTVGKALAERLGHNNHSAFPFIDLDEYIVKREGRSIKNIFDIDGEEYFRKLEIKCMHVYGNPTCNEPAICTKCDQIIIDAAGIEQQLKENGINVWLMTTRYNKNVDDFERVSSWREIYSKIK